MIVEGHKEVARRLRQFAGQMPGVVGRKGLRLVAKIQKGAIRNRLLTTKRDSSGSPWAPWSDAYAETRTPPRHSLLRDTYAMTKTLKTQARAGGIDLGSPEPYARFHQEGDGVPERDFLGVSSDDVPEMQSALDDFAMEEMERRGLT